MSEKSKILEIIADFLQLNEIRRNRALSREEVENWYALKQRIELDLFANPPSKSDRRRSLRLRNLRLAVVYESAFGAMEGVIREASEGGLFLAAQEPLPVGTDFAVTVPLVGPQSSVEDPVEEVEIPVRVIYTNTAHSFGDRAFSGMGVIITDAFSAKNKQRWFRFLDQMLEDLVSKGLSEWNQ